MHQSRFLKKAAELGIDAVFFLEPRVWRFGSTQIPAGLCEDPFKIMPDAKCQVALIKSYKPFLPRTDGGPNLSSFYFASHKLFRACEALSSWCEVQGLRLFRAELPAKGMLAQCGVASILKNSLAAIPGLGTRYTLQWMLTDAFEPNPDPTSPIKCLDCNSCAIACPTGAISKSGFNPGRCLRFQLNGQMIPNWAKEKMSCMLGCEICQAACPHNESITTIETPEFYKDLFSYTNMLKLYDINKRSFAEEIGKNMMSRDRIPAQAFVLASNANNFDYMDCAVSWMNRGSDCIKDASHWYIYSNR